MRPTAAVPSWTLTPPLDFSPARNPNNLAIREVRPLLAARGFAVPGRPGLRLRTLADVFAYASAQGVELRLDGTEVQVRRPRASKPGRRAFVSGKKNMNTKKATVVTDGEGRTLRAGAFRPGPHARPDGCANRGTADLFEQFPEVKAKVDAGYRLGRGAPPAVTGTDLRGARQRRAPAVADPPAVPWTTRRLRRDLHGRCRPGLRPRRREVITNQAIRQASTPRPQSRTTSLGSAGDLGARLPHRRTRCDMRS